MDGAETLTLTSSVGMSHTPRHACLLLLNCVFNYFLDAT